jgi:hypothetical protein
LFARAVLYGRIVAMVGKKMERGKADNRTGEAMHPKPAPGENGTFRNRKVGPVFGTITERTP